MKLAGYSGIERLYDSTSSSVFRARRLSDGQPIILKVLHERDGDTDRVIRYRQEFDIAALLKFPEAIRIYSLMPHGRTFLMEIEDFGGESLAHWLGKERLPLQTLLDIGAKAAGQLAQIHASHVIHKDISPGNIVWNPTTGQVKIIDFGIAIPFSAESPQFQGINVIQGTLAYISPEQTGRMNRALDYRTDLYSLGATLYHLLTGAPPFRSTDSLELVHCHLAKRPAAPESLQPDLPLPVSRIITKLLSKAADERYQSARSVELDLKDCLEQLRRTGTITDFSLGRGDFRQTLQISQRLYGRDQEVAQLLQAVDRAAQGARELMLVCGYSGIGKSSVVQEVFRPITERRGLYGSGKYDQYQRHIPSSAIVAAFRSVIRHILTEDEASIKHWKHHLLAALGNTGAALIEVIPELERITGPQPPLPAVDSIEAQARFQHAFRQFVHVLATPEHPLVLFLDDLQWADPASLKLIEFLCKDEALHNLLLIGAYRDNEVDDLHPLTALIKGLKGAAAPVSSIVLRPLTERDLVHLLADTLNTSSERVESLAAILFSKTQGNPFFAIQFIKALYRKGLLYPVLATETWAWDADGIAAMSISDNVVDLLLERFADLPAPTQEALKVASLLGNRFQLQHLATGLSLPPEAAFAALRFAIDEQVVVPLSQHEQTRIGDIAAPLIISEFRFGHDRLQQASFQLIPAGDRMAAHLRIGRLLRAELGRGILEESLFDVVEHLNIAASLITDEAERKDLGMQNLEAGRKAMAAQAYSTAAVFLGHAGELLPSDLWQRDPALAYEVVVLHGDAEAQAGNFQAAERLLLEALSHTADKLKRIRIYELLIRQYTLCTDYPKCLEMAIPALALAGIDLPPKDFDAALGENIARFEQRLSGRSLGQLADAPVSNHPVARAIMNLLETFLPATYFIHPSLLLLGGVISCNLSLEHGIQPESAVGLSLYGMFLAVTGHSKRAAEFGKLAVKLSDRFEQKSAQCTAYLLYAGYVAPWAEAAAPLDDYFDRSFHAGVQAGNRMMSGFTRNNVLSHLVCRGDSLEHALEYVPGCRKFTSETGNIMAFDCVQVFELALLNLLGKTAGPDVYSADNVESAAAFLRRCEQNKSGYGVCAFYTMRGMVRYLYGDAKAAYQDLKTAKSMLSQIPGSIINSTFQLYMGLAAAEQCAAEKGQAATAAVADLAQASAQVRVFAENCPDNYLSHHLLLLGRQAELEGRLFEAVNHYADGLVAAGKSGNLYVAGTAEELLADLWCANGRKDYAYQHAQSARQIFSRWGAPRKVALLDEKYRQRLGALFSDGKSGDRTRAIIRSPSATTTTSRTTTASLDLMSFAKASQSIAEEIILERLQRRLMQLLLEEAGAQTAALLSVRDNTLYLDAEITEEGAAPKVCAGTPFESWQGGARGIVQFVRRTGESIVLGNAAGDANFALDPHIAAKRVKSVLCVPIKNRTGLIAILYFENNLTANAFSKDRIEMLRVLGGQIAISLENARLYDDLSRALILARESERLKTEFLANTSHELRTPLNSIINIPKGIIGSMREHTLLHCKGCGATFEPAAEELTQPLPACPECGHGALEMQTEWISSQAPERLLSYLKSVESSGRHLLALVNNILDYTRLESGQAKLHSEVLDAAQVLETVTQSISPMAGERNIELRILPPSGSGVLRADPVKLRQILTNLIDNAIKFSNPGGRVELQHTADGQHFNLSVRDFGIGIPASSQQTIFERFRQVEAGHTRSRGGSGLGLAITKKLVELHGGTIRVESQPDRGSTFTVTLPLPLQDPKLQRENPEVTP